MKEVSITTTFTTCTACPHHQEINDGDPHDSFCSDDVAIVCTKTPNPKKDEESRWKSDRSDYRSVVRSCRPYNVKKEAKETGIPDWCPLAQEEPKQTETPEKKEDTDGKKP